MKIKKIIFTLMFSLILAVSSFSQSKGVTIDNALKQAAEQFSSSLKNKTTVAILGISSSYSELSEYMLGELTTDIVQLRKLQVVTRANLDVIKKEMSFQLSGEVSDETMQQLGAKTGAQTVISGSLKPLGTLYVLDIQAFDVTTATIQDTYRVNVASDETLNLLTKKTVINSRGKIKNNNDYTTGERIGMGFSNLLFGLGSYCNGHWGDGLILTGSKIVSASLIIAAVAYASKYDEDDYYYEHYDIYGNVWYSYYDDDANSEAIKKITGLMIAGCGIGVASVVYGFVRPFFYHKNSNVKISMNVGAVQTSHGFEPGISYNFSW